jgi:hypothetical protein
MSSDKYAAALVHWARKRRKQHHAANAQANEQVLSFAAKTQAQTLHNKEPRMCLCISTFSCSFFIFHPLLILKIIGLQTALLTILNVLLKK